MKNVYITWQGRKWCHQQVRGLMQEIGQAGEVKVGCHYGVWRADIYFKGLSGLGHGETMWLALKRAVDQSQERCLACGGSRRMLPEMRCPYCDRIDNK